jgi:putative SOS response-associated peptidase YedK
VRSLSTLGVNRSLVNIFDSVSGEEDWTPRFNIAPTQSVPVIRQNPKEPRRELSLVRCLLD